MTGTQMGSLVDRDLLIELMARFESGGDFSEANPFENPAALLEVHNEAEAFLSSCVKDTKDVLERMESGADPAPSVALAAMFQGLAIGFEYAMQKVSSVLPHDWKEL